MGRGVQPEGEPLRKAVRWISDRRKEDPQAKLARLLDEASQQFDLSPRDSDYLFRLLTAPQEP